METMICSSLGGNDIADDLFDLLDVIFGQFDARAGRTFHVDDELAGVGAREKRDPEKRIENETQERNSGTATDSGTGNTRRRTET